MTARSNGSNGSDPKVREAKKAIPLKALSQTKLFRSSSLHFDDKILAEPLDIRNLNVPKLPRQRTLHRTVERPLDWTGAPKSPFFVRTEHERDVPVTHAEAGFQVLPVGSPLRLTLQPPSFHTHHHPPPLNPVDLPSSSGGGDGGGGYGDATWRSSSGTPGGDYALRPLYGSSMQSAPAGGGALFTPVYSVGSPTSFGGGGSSCGGGSGSCSGSSSFDGSGAWAHTQGPTSPKAGTGGRGAPFVASASTTRHGRPAHYSQTFRGSPMHVQKNFPKIRQLPPAIALKHTNPLSGARSLEHRVEIMKDHGIEGVQPYSGPGADAEESEGRNKIAVMKLKPFIKDTYATVTWDLEQPLKKWKRVRTDASGAIVTGLSLVSTRLEGDLAVLGPLFGAFEHLELLLIHSNERVTGDIQWLCTLFALKELRLSAGRMSGDITGFSALVKLTKLIVYNRQKEDLKGLVEDLRSQMPGCTIDVDIKTHNGI